MQVGAVNVTSCSTKHIQRPIDDGHGLAIDPIGFLSSAAEQGPSFVLDIADVDIVAITFPKWDSSAPKHKQVVAMQYK